MQYVNSVINNGSYANAYFEIGYVKAFGVNSSVAISPSSAAAAAPNQATGGSGSATKSSSGSSATNSTNNALGGRMDIGGVMSILGAGVLALISGLVL